MNRREAEQYRRIVLPKLRLARPSTEYSQDGFRSLVSRAQELVSGWFHERTLFPGPHKSAIYVTSGEGYGANWIAAFDTALKDAGVHDYNHEPLSSVIPKRSAIVVEKPPTNGKEVGYRLIVVESILGTEDGRIYGSSGSVIKSKTDGGEKHRDILGGNHIGAALAWVQFSDGSGVFVEHKAHDTTAVHVEEQLEEDARASLKQLCENREVRFQAGAMGIAKQIARVDDPATCVAVIAVYQSKGWR